MEGVSQPPSRKSSIASDAELRRRIQSSWRNRISSHGAAELGGPPEPQKHHLFYTTKEKKRFKERVGCVNVRTYVCVGGRMGGGGGGFGPRN